MITDPDPFGTPGQSIVPDRGDEFGTPGEIERSRRRGDAEDRALVPRDQYDRYLMPQLDGTKPSKGKGLTRVSTTKAALANTIGIQKWTSRLIIDGIGQSPDLVEQAMRASAMSDDDPAKKKALARIAEAAFVLGGGKERSGLGTEFHELTEDLNRGVLDRTKLDSKWLPELAAYEQLLVQENIQVLPDMLERQVLCPYNQAGTFDNMFRYWNEITQEWELVIGDLKTGRSLDLGWLEILIQLWNYANAYGLFTATKIVYSTELGKESEIVDVEGYYTPMPPELRKDKALIIHVPLDGTAGLYVLDLGGVQAYVEAAVTAKRANAEAKLKVRKLGSVTPAAFTVDQLPATLDVNGRTAPAGSPAYAGALAAQRTQPPTHPGATPDQIATAQLAEQRQQAAAETLARVDAAAVAEGRNDGDDEPTETGRKKRSCSICRKPGHTARKCPLNPDSPNYRPKGELLSPEQSAQLIEAATAPVVNPIELTGADPASGAPLTNVANYIGEIEPATEAELAEQGEPPYIDYGADLVAEEQAPYCTGGHQTGWTSTYPDKLNQWVCGTCGKPSRGAWESGQTLVTSVPPLYGAPVNPDQIGGPNYQPATAEQINEATAQEAAAATVPPAEWPAPPDPRQLTQIVLDDIAAAGNQADVLTIRQKAIESGSWVESLHNQPAMARYHALGPFRI
jgi:hypothetical protein